MEANHQKPTSLLVMSLSIVLVGSVMFDMYKNNVATDSQTENTALNATVDSLSLVKEKLSRDVETVAADLRRKAETMEPLFKKYKEINAGIRDKTVLLNEIKSSNARLRSGARDRNDQVNVLNDQIAGLNALKTRLEHEISSIPQLEKTIVVYKTVNDSLETTHTEKEREVVTVSDNIGEVKNQLTADRFRVEVLTERNTITAKAKKGKTLHISMILPEHLKKQLKEREEVYVSILDQDMQPVEGAIAEVPLSSEYLQKHSPVKYHAVQSTAINPQEIKFIIRLNKRLNPGIYVAKFHTTHQYIGSVGFKLKDSFLFF